MDNLKPYRSTLSFLNTWFYIIPAEATLTTNRADIGKSQNCVVRTRSEFLRCWITFIPPVPYSLCLFCLHFILMTDKKIIC